MLGVGLAIAIIVRGSSLLFLSQVAHWGLKDAAFLALAGKRRHCLDILQHVRKELLV
jgi:hypothetical protein